MRGTLVVVWPFIVRMVALVVRVVALVVVMRVIDLWRRAHVCVLVVVLVIEGLLDSVLLGMEQMADLIDQMLVRGDVQVDQRL